MSDNKSNNSLLNERQQKVENLMDQLKSIASTRPDDITIFSLTNLRQPNGDAEGDVVVSGSLLRISSAICSAMNQDEIIYHIIKAAVHAFESFTCRQPSLQTKEEA